MNDIGGMLTVEHNGEGEVSQCVKGETSLWRHNQRQGGTAISTPVCLREVDFVANDPDRLFPTKSSSCFFFRELRKDFHSFYVSLPHVALSCDLA
jgi:hypothetical protein